MICTWSYMWTCGLRHFVQQDLDPRNPETRWIGELVPVLVEAGLSSVQPEVETCWNLETLHRIQQNSIKSAELCFFCGGRGGVLSFGEVLAEPSPGRDWTSHLWYFVQDRDATIEEVEFSLNLQDFAGCRSSANKKLHNIPADQWIERYSADVGWLIKQLRANRRFYGFCEFK